MAKILVAGGVDEDGEGGKSRAQFAEALDRTIVRRGHILLGGCRTQLDAIDAFLVRRVRGGRERRRSRIFSHIKSSAFVIAELSAAKPNVYYEIGFARALGKAVIHTAKEGTPLPFDVFDVPTLFYDGQTSLATKLDDAISRLFNP